MQTEEKLDYITGKNINWMHSFWTLVNMAHGADYYAFADQDDIWFPDKLARAVSVLEKYGETPAIYSAQQSIVDDNLNVLHLNEQKVDCTNFLKRTIWFGAIYFEVALKYGITLCRIMSCRNI